jgi:prepilin-type N-terminal cleavage/methylation domain-containing protein
MKQRTLIQNKIKDMLHQSCGFSMAEIIIALVIFSIIAMGFNSMLLISVRANSSSREIIKATSLGKKVLEEINSQQFDSIINGSDTINQKYIRCWIVNKIEARKEVYVTVVWPVESKKHFIHFSTIISRP